MFVLQCRRQKTVLHRCTEGLFGVQAWNFNFETADECSGFLSLWNILSHTWGLLPLQKNINIYQNTQKPLNLKPPFPLAGISVLVPVVIPQCQLNHIFMYDLFFNNKYFFSERVHLKQDILTANTPAFLLLDSKVKFTFLVCWEECCPLGLWTRSEDYKSVVMEEDWDSQLQVCFKDVKTRG